MNSSTSIDNPAAPLAEMAEEGTSVSRVFLETFGCQMNFLDTEFLQGQFREASYEIVPRSEDADVVCFNTCAVRDHAEARVRSRIGALKTRKEQNPRLVIAVIGCMAQREGKDLLSSWPQVDIVCGTREFHRLPSLWAGPRKSGTPRVLGRRQRDGAPP